MAKQKKTGEQKLDLYAMIVNYVGEGDLSSSALEAKRDGSYTFGGVEVEAFVKMDNYVEIFKWHLDKSRAIASKIDNADTQVFYNWGKAEFNPRESIQDDSDLSRLTNARKFIVLAKILERQNILDMGEATFPETFLKEVYQKIGIKEARAEIMSQEDLAKADVFATKTVNALASDAMIEGMNKSGLAQKKAEAAAARAAKIK